jgi:hypothetical protein
MKAEDMDYGEFQAAAFLVGSKISRQISKLYWAAERLPLERREFRHISGSSPKVVSTDDPNYQ